MHMYSHCSCSVNVGSPLGSGVTNLNVKLIKSRFDLLVALFTAILCIRNQNMLI